MVYRDGSESRISAEATVTQVIGLPDGRSVTVECSGDPKGFPVVFMHGTPGGRTGPLPRPPLLYQLGVRLISYDRPGYGGSDRKPGRTVADAAADVLAIADHLALPEFSVVGRSGGGPHALACAALIGEKRIRNAAVLVGIAPTDAKGLDWVDGMADSNVIEHERAAIDDGKAVEDELTARAAEILRDPQNLLNALEKEMVEADIRVASDAAIRRRLLETYRQAVTHGPYGWIDDVLAFRRPWGFDLSDVIVPVRLWHGTDDVFAPPAHARWLARHIRDVTIELAPGAAHFDAVEILPRILVRLQADARQRRERAGAGSEGLRV